MKKKLSEFRKDIVSGDWILVASKRGRRPVFFNHDKKTDWRKLPHKDCPFDDPQKSGNGKPIFWLSAPIKSGGGKVAKPNIKDWFVQVISNKFPAVSPSKICPIPGSFGWHSIMAGVGFHEVVITRPHDRSLSEMTKEEATLVLRAYVERMLALREEKCVEYTSVFHNHGRSAGASVVHPHSQIIALPIIPPDVARSFEGSRRYFTEHGHCVHCTMLEWELAEKDWIIFQNEHFIALAPYASRVSYEVRVYPKWHASHFEEMDEEKLCYLAEALTESLRRLRIVLGDPDYNFFLHTAPTKEKYMEHYHWHFEILPKTGIWAGLELGTGIDIISTSPEEAAKELRKASTVLKFK
jgi:UDPglucose--hexose-1-phosphate uridylyltransferase